MKRILQTFSVLTAFLLFALATPAYATGHAYFADGEWAGVNDLMNRAAASPEVFGVEGVDLESLYVTDAIATYDYYEGELIRGTDVWLAYEGQDLVFAFWGPFSGTYTMVPYLGSFERALATLDSSCVALIRDRNGINITDGSEMLLTKESTDEDLLLLDELPIDFRTVDGWEDVVLTDVTAYSALGYEMPIQGRSLAFESGYWYCDVPHPYQNYTYTCWAACSVSLLRYRGYWPSSLYGFSTFNDGCLAYAVYLYSPNTGGGETQGFDVTRDETEVRDILNYCLQRTGPADHAYEVHYGCPSYSAFYAYVNADSPVIGLMEKYNTDTHRKVSGTGHMTIINGYEDGGNKLCMWWPEEGENPWAVELLYEPYYNVYYYHSPYSPDWIVHYVWGTIYETY